MGSPFYMVCRLGSPTFRTNVGQMISWSQDYCGAAVLPKTVLCHGRDVTSNSEVRPNMLGSGLSVLGAYPSPSLGS